MISKILINRYLIDFLSIRENNAFFRESIALDLLDKKIKYSKISFGIIAVLNINNLSWTKEEKNDILSKIKNTTEIEHGGFCFKVSRLDYAIFIPLSDGELKQDNAVINNEIKLNIPTIQSLNSIFKFHSDKKNKIIGFISIYGPSSSDINELISKSKFLMNNKFVKNNKENLIIFDHKKYSKLYKIKMLLQSISDYLDNTTISFIESIHQPEIYYSIIKYKGKNIFDLKYELSEFEFLFFLRAISKRAIEKFNYFNKGKKLVIPYSLSIFKDDNFNIDKFFESIKESAEPNKIILLFEEEKITTKVIKIINTLRKEGVEFPILNPIEKKLEKQNIEKLKPLYQIKENKDDVFNNLFIKSKDEYNFLSIQEI